MAPFLAVSHDDGAAFCVVVGQAEFLDSLFAGQTKLLVDFVFDRYSMSIPTESSLDIMPLHGPVPRNNIFDGGGKEMAVMGQARSERRAIVERVSWFVFRQLNLHAASLSAHHTDLNAMAGLRLTWRSKALISRHFSMTATSALGKSMDIVESPAQRC